MSKKIVIIGGVAGGASAAARMRRIDEGAEIVVLEKGGFISFANCGLPYYIGNVIEERDKLLVQTPEAMEDRFNIDIRIKNEALGMDELTSAASPEEGRIIGDKIVGDKIEYNE